MKSIKFILSILGLILPLSVNAYDAEVGGIYYNLNKNAMTAEVTYGDNNLIGSIAIPKTISYEGGAYQVTSIGERAFRSNGDLTAITIPNGVTTIGEFAFEGCRNLSSINIPESVTAIQKGAFMFCGFTSIKLPNNLSAIDNSLFDGCYDLTSIDLPSSITSIKEYAFSSAGLTSIIIPENVTSLGSHAFDGCKNLTSITLPDNLGSIGSDCFNRCEKLTSITLPYSLYYVGKNAFQNCSSLTKVVFNCKELSVNYDTYSWFSNNIYFVTSIEIGDNVEEIKSLPFTYFDIESIQVSPNNKKYDSRNNCNAIIETTSNTLVGGCKNTIVPNDVTAIGDNAFSNCSKLTTLNLPNSITSIGEYAFYNCSNLTSIIIPEGVTKIQASTFNGCSSLDTIVFPDDISSVGENAFNNCAWFNARKDSLIYLGKNVYYCTSNLEEGTEIVLKEGTKRILSRAFSSCKKLRSIQIPESVVFIGDDAFEGSGLQSVIVPESVKTIGDYAFSSCDSLKEVTLPKTLTEMGHSIFYDCHKLSSVNIPNNIKTIPYGTFWGCHNLTSVDISESVDSIMDYAFMECKGLTSVIIPQNVTYIGAYPFQECDSLHSVTIIGDLTYLGVGAFLYCTNIKEVTCGSDQPLYISSYRKPDIFHSSVYENANLYVPVQSIEAYKGTTPWSNFKKIGGLLDSTLKLVCMIGDKDVTSEVTIKWMNDNGEEIGDGTTLECYKSQQLSYSILLNETMGRQYHEVVNELVCVTGDSTITCQLQKIENIALAGRVSAEDIAEITATVRVKQMLNGKYEETFTTLTNDKGEFSLDGYDDDTEIIISCDGYLDAVIHRSRFNGYGDLGVITMKPITGFVAPVTINCIAVESEDNALSADLLPGGLYDLTFTMRNESTGNDITDFYVQYNGTLVINSGASAWDLISIIAKSKKGVFAEVTTYYYADEDGTSSIELNFIELGGISATYASSGNSGTVGYLYDSNGLLVARDVYNGETMQMKHIQEGYYTLVSMGQSSVLSNVFEMSTLTDLGMVEGKDYVTTQVEVYNGEITVVSVGSIPKLNESLFLFDGSLLADRSYVIVGNYVTLSARVNIEEELYKKVNDVYLTFDLPEGCQLVENSIMVNRSEQTYTLNGNTLSIHLPKDQALGEIRYCVIPIEANSYRSTAYVSFDKEITSPRPLGVAQFESEELSFRAPSTTANTRVSLSGITNPYSDVKVYDGDIQIGTTTANGEGSWTAECELYNAYNHSYHDILVKAKTQEGLTLTSSVKKVLYNQSCIVPASVSMTFYNGWHKENITVDFDLINGTTSKKHYDFYTESDFTFLARFTNNDPELVDDVNFMVKASDGTIRTLPALFDSKRQAWVATSKYDSDKLPQNVTVEYNAFHEDSDDDRDAMILDQTKHLAALANHVDNYIRDNTYIELIDESDDMALLRCYFNDSYSYINCRLENIDYATAERMMLNNQFDYFTTDKGDMGEYVEFEEYSIKITITDLARSKAYRLTLSDPYYDSSYAKGKPANAAPRKINKSYYSSGGFLADFGEFAGQLGTLAGVSDYISVKSDFDNMQDRRRTYLDSFNKTRDNTVKKMTANCPDGSPRLTKQTRAGFMDKWNAILAKENKFEKKYDKYVSEYKKKLAWSVGTFVGTSVVGMGLSALAKSSKFISSELNELFKSLLSKNVTAENSAKIFANHMGIALDCIIEDRDRVTDYKNFKKVRDKLLSWSSDSHDKILREYIALNKQIESAYSSCKKYDPVTHEVTDPWQENFVERKDDNTTSFTTPPVEPILDPSGFVYEAVLSNRLPGVTTTVYQKQNGNAVKWNAEDYSQENPLVTDEASFYRWDVPQGEWQVKYEKDGYETCYSEWLPVPPPQLDVNVGMKQNTPPSVKQMRGVESGITIEMSKYMLPESMNDNNIVVKMDGATRNGHLEMLNTEESPTGDDIFLSKVKFVPEDEFHAGDEVYVTVKGSVESYCAVQMGADHTEKVVIQPEITAIVIDSVLTVPYEGTKTVQVLVMPQEVSAGKTLNARLSSNLITSVDNEMITIDENGLATLTLNGDLPGSALLTLTMDNTDVSAESKVKVDVEYEVASTPTSSIRNGEQVAAGTMLSLTCETEGATIYYTLDGSCPCNEATRIRYTGPFALTEGVVTVKAIAVAEYLYDSDVATFIYQVSSQTTGINTVATENHDFRAAYVNGAIVIEGAEGANCKIYDLAGRELSGKDSLNRYDAISVSIADTYVVFLKFADGKTAVRKILRQ